MNTERTHDRRCARRGLVARLLLAVVALWSGACSSTRVEGWSNPLDPEASEEGSPPGESDLERASPEEVQSLVMGMADEYGVGLAEAVYLVVRDDGATPRSRWLAQSFLRNGMGAAIDIGVGSNPGVNLLDLLVLGSLQTWAFETHWIPAGIDPDAGARSLARLRAVEDALWASSRRVLSDDQAEVLRALIDRWIERHPDRTVVSLVRFEEFTDQRRTPALAHREEASGLLAEVTEVTSAISDAELLGERLLWFAGRFPYVLGQQAELTAYRIADQPEIAALRRLGDDLEALLEVSSKRLDQLTTDIATERRAAIADLSRERELAIQQAFDRLAEERRRTFDELESRQDTLGALAQQVEATVVVAEGLATAATDTFDALDRIVARFDEQPDATREPLRFESMTEVAVESRKTAETLTELLDKSLLVLDSPKWDERLASFERATSQATNRLLWGLGLLLLAGLLSYGALRWFLDRRSARGE